MVASSVQRQMHHGACRVGARALPGARAVAASRRRVQIRKTPVCAAHPRGPQPSRAAEVAIEAPPAVESKPLSEMSYDEQYNTLYSKQRPNLKQAVPKPVRELQAQEPGSKKILLSDVYGKPKRSLLDRKWNATDLAYAVFIGGMHVAALLAPATFSWPMVGLFAASYFITGCFGITLGYHRMLSHRSFNVPKWLEYFFAYCGVLAVQGDPIEWASSHRYHHQHCDTPFDPHSPYEGFWWSHMGWLLDNEATLQRVGDRSNAIDLSKDAFYVFLQKTYVWHVVGMFAALYLAGGLPAVIWGGALRVVWVYHITWFVNSASHCWGTQAFNTGDLSRNNWWVGILAWGEGWHNNHHAFQASARHGLEWWQFDMTWMIISGLQKLGLATNVKLPSQQAMDRLAIKPAAQS